MAFLGDSEAGLAIKRMELSADVECLNISALFFGELCLTTNLA